MNEEKLKCPYCGRAFLKKVHNQKYCSDACRDLVHYYAKTHRLTLGEADAFFASLIDDKERKDKARAEEKKNAPKELRWVTISSSAGYYAYV